MVSQGTFSIAELTALRAPFSVWSWVQTHTSIPPEMGKEKPKFTLAESNLKFIEVSHRVMRGPIPGGPRGEGLGSPGFSLLERDKQQQRADSPMACYSAAQC